MRHDTLHVAHVGDSRAYLCREGQISQLTRDHSMVQELVEAGRLTSEEAENYPHKNLITKALGVEPGVQADYSSMPAQPGDVILMCSDGLSGVVPDSQLLAIIQHNPFFTVPRRLVEQALQAGGQDNITALLIEVEQTED